MPITMHTRSGFFLKATMTWGAYLGFAMVAFHFLTYLFKTSPDSTIHLLSYVITIGFIVYGQKYWRAQLGGFISYGEALKVGIVISLFAGIIYGFYQYILTGLIDPELIERQLRNTEEVYLQLGYSEEEVETMMALSARMNTPIGISFSVAFGYTIGGLIFSLITSIFTRRIDDSFDAQTKTISDDYA